MLRLSILALSLSLAGSVLADPAPVFDGTKSALENRVGTLERMLKARNEALIRLQSQIDSLQDELNQVRGENESHGHKLSQLLERQRELYQELDKRVAVQKQPVAVSEPSPNTSYVSTLSEQEAYDKASNLVLKHKLYDQAIPAFQAFLKNYPDSKLVANAHYWLGQLYFYKLSFESAQAEFEQVVNFHTDSNKRPEALDKLAMVAQKLGNKARAIQLYEQLMAEYPESSSAKLAQPRLRALKSSSGN